MAEMTIHHLTREDIDRNLDPGRLRLAQILQFALTAGPVSFLGVVLLIRFTAGPAEAVADSPTRLLLMVLGPLAVANYALAVFLDRLILAPDKLQARLPAQDDPAGWVGAMMNQHRTLLIIRMAVLEAASFYGLVIVLVGATDGSLAQQPSLWLGVLPTVIQLLFSVATFPSRSNLVQFLDQRMVKPLQRISD